MTNLAEIDVGLRRPGQTAVDRIRLWLQCKRAYYAHSPTITPYDLIEAVDNQPDWVPVTGTPLLPLMRNACCGQLTSAELEDVLDGLEREKAD